MSVTYYKGSHKVTNSSSTLEKISAKNDAKVFLNNYTDNIIDASTFLNAIYMSLIIMTKIRHTTYRTYVGNNNNGAAVTYRLKSTEIGNGQYTNTKSNTAKSLVYNNPYVDNIVRSIIVKTSINNFYTTLKTDFNNWVNSQSEWINYYSCHTNCHSSCYHRSRR